MSRGHRFVEEVDAHFPTSLAVVTCSLIDNGEFEAVLGNQKSEAAQKQVDLLQCDMTYEDARRFPSLYALQEAFAPVALCQKELEEGRNPTMHMVLPMFRHLQHQLTEHVNGVHNYRMMDTPIFWDSSPL